MSAAVIFRMGADSAGLRKDLEAAGQMAKRTAGKMTGAIGAGLKAGLAGLGVGAVIAAGKEIIDFAGNLADASDAMGITTDALQELHGAFGQSGASTETVNKGLAKLSENLTTAKAGGTAGAAMVTSFKALGVTWEEINTLAPDEILMRIAASAKDATNPAERLASIVDVLGKAGLKMAAGLNGGEEALKSLREQVSKLSAADIKVLDDFGDKWDRLGNSAKVAAAKVVLAIPRLFNDMPVNQIAYEREMAARQGSASEAAALGAASGATGAKAKPKAAIPDSPEMVAEKKRVQELRDFEAEQYRQFTERKRSAGEKAAADEKERIQELRDFEAEQFREFTESTRVAAENAAEKQKKLAADVAKAQQAGAQQLADAEENLEKKKSERSKATLAEMAGTFRNAEGAKARRVQRLEERGKKFAGRDEEKSAKLFQQADDLRKKIVGLKEEDKGLDFQAALEKAKIFKDIHDELKNLRNAQ